MWLEGRGRVPQLVGHQSGNPKVAGTTPLLPGLFNHSELFRVIVQVANRKADSQIAIIGNHAIFGLFLALLVPKIQTLLMAVIEVHANVIFCCLL